MTAEILDFGILVLIVLSAIIGLIRGFVREALSLLTWVAAFGFAAIYFKPLAQHLPFSGQSEVVKLGISFAVIFFTVLIIGAIVNHLITTAIASIGLGGVDHILGGIFGVLRGGLIVTLLVLLLSLTTVSKNAWWQDSILMPWFEKAAVEVKAMIPQDFSGYFEHTPQDAAK